MLWCVMAVVMLFGVSQLLALLAGDHRMRQFLARREHHRMRCLVASQMISALRRALTPAPLVSAADPEAEEAPPTLAEEAVDLVSAAEEGPGQLGCGGLGRGVLGCHTARDSVAARSTERSARGVRLPAVSTGRL